MALWTETMGECDIAAVRALEEAAFSTTWQEGAFRNELKNPCAHYIVLRDEEPPTERLAGYAGFWLVVDEVHITSIAVSTELRGQGAGKRLLYSLLCRARKHGAKWATLEVRQDNLPAQKLYRRFGFAKVGTRKAYYESKVDGWIMWAGNLLSESYTERLQRVIQPWPEALHELETVKVES